MRPCQFTLRNIRFQVCLVLAACGCVLLALAPLAARVPAVVLPVAFVCAAAADRPSLCALLRVVRRPAWRRTREQSCSATPGGSRSMPTGVLLSTQPRLLLLRHCFTSAAGCCVPMLAAAVVAWSALPCLRVPAAFVDSVFGLFLERVFSVVTPLFVTGHRACRSTRSPSRCPSTSRWCGPSCLGCCVPVAGHDSLSLLARSVGC